MSFDFLYTHHATTRIEAQELNFEVALSSKRSQPRYDELEPGSDVRSDARNALDTFTKQFAFRDFEDEKSVCAYCFVLPYNT